MPDFDRVILVVDNALDWELYAAVLPLYFPRTEPEARAVSAQRGVFFVVRADLDKASRVLPADCGNEWGETVIEERAIRVGRLDGDSGDDEEDEDSCVFLFAHESRAT